MRRSIFKPDLAFAFNGRGNAYYSKGEYDSAISDYNEAIRFKPDLAFALNGRWAMLITTRANTTKRFPITMKPSDATRI